MSELLVPLSVNLGYRLSWELLLHKSGLVSMGDSNNPFEILDRELEDN